MNERMKRINELLRNCVFKYGPIKNVERTLQQETLGFQTLYDFNDIYEHEYKIVHYYNNHERSEDILIQSNRLNRIKEFIDKNLQSIRVSCFSETPVNNLMWSHYSDHHRGVAYCFDKSSFLKSNFPYGKVIYSSSIPEVTIFQDKTTEGMARAHLDQVILTKSIDWEYEKEIRYFRRQDEKFSKYYPKGLRAIIAGRKTSNEDISKIKKEISMFNNKNGTTVELLYASRLAGSYSLHIEEHENLRDGNFGAAIPVRNDIDSPLLSISPINLS